MASRYGPNLFVKIGRSNPDNASVGFSTSPARGMSLACSYQAGTFWESKD